MDDMEQPIGTGPSPLAEIAHKEFTVVLRGYDRDEVDQFLVQVEDALQELVERVQDRPAPGHLAEWMGNEVAAIIAAAEAAAERIRRDATASADAVRLQAEADAIEARKVAERSRSDAARLSKSVEEETAKLRAEGEEEATRLRRDAEEEGADIKLRAQEESERILREARLVAQRVENAAQARREEILADARRAVRDLKEREKEIHARIAALEETFGALRGAVSGQAGIAEEDRTTDERRVVDLGEAEREAREKSS